MFDESTATARNPCRKTEAGNVGTVARLLETAKTATLTDVNIERTKTRIGVFCGSKVGTDERYQETVAELGRLLVQQGHGLVFGGGSIGLMGVLADAVLAAGGEVVGVIPEMLATRELLHPDVADMRTVPNMHDRKSLIAELADAFVALPGGYGTFEELFEVITWAQLGIHHKNIGLLNIAGYFDPLVQLIEHAIEEGFIKPAHRELIVVDDRPAPLLQKLAEHRLPEVRRWMGPEEI